MQTRIRGRDCGRGAGEGSGSGERRHLEGFLRREMELGGGV